MASEKKLLEHIKKNNDKAQASTLLKHCLLHTIDCMKEYNDNSELKAINDLLDRDEKNDIGPLNEHEQRILQEYTNIYEQVKIYKKVCGFKQSEITRFEALGNDDPQKRIDGTWDLVTEKKIALEGELHFLAKRSSKHWPFVSMFGSIICPTTSRYNPRIDFSLKRQNYDEWLKNKEAFELAQKTKTWYHRNKLTWIYRVLTNGEAEYKRLMDLGLFLEATDVSALYNGLRSGLELGPKIGRNAIKLEELKYSLQKIVDYTEKNLESYSKPNMTNDPESKSIPTYDGGTGILNVYDTEIDFDVQADRHKILEIGFPNGIPAQNGIAHDIIYDEALKTDADLSWHQLNKETRAEIKKKIREICRGINDRVEQKAKEKISIATSKGGVVHFGYDSQ